MKKQNLVLFINLLMYVCHLFSVVMDVIMQITFSDDNYIFFFASSIFMLKIYVIFFSIFYRYLFFSIFFILSFFDLFINSYIHLLIY